MVLNGVCFQPVLDNARHNAIFFELHMGVTEAAWIAQYLACRTGKYVGAL